MKSLSYVISNKAFYVYNLLFLLFICIDLGNYPILEYSHVAYLVLGKEYVFSDD